MIDVVIPMAGEGARFVRAGYTVPKPFIEARGSTLIELVLENLRLHGARYILLARAEHLASQAATVARIRRNFDVRFVTVDRLTEGAACTVLHAHRLIGDAPLLIANSDQLVESDVAGYVADCGARGLDGSILTFEDAARDPKWSFAQVDDRGLVTQVREKVAISQHATVGLYYFSRGSSFVRAALDMILANDRVNGEFYVCPVYNYCIRAGERIGIHEIPAERMHGLGTPADLERYVARFA